MSELKNMHLHLDCASGAAGDMTLGALLDMGVPRDAIDSALDALGLGADRLRVTRVIKHGVSAVDVKVDTRSNGSEPMFAHGQGAHVHGQGAHSHARGEHSHTHYRDIKAMIANAELEPEVEERALDMFERVARAESRLHGVSMEDVAFHELGAIDSIVDIVGTAAALTWLAPSSVSAASVAVGHGTLQCAHGLMPVPAPATVEILREVGGVMDSGGVARELCTPTGAAILASAVTEWKPMPAMVPVATGYGAGDMDLPDRANVMRAMVGRLAGEPSELGGVWRIEANIDDMNPELCEYAATQAFAAGALDVWWTPVVMKKGRPALVVSALADEASRDAVMAALLRETTTIGVRYHMVNRRVLGRMLTEVVTVFGRVMIKVALLDGKVMNAAPEYESCRIAAQEHGVALKEVFAAARTAYEQQRLSAAIS